MNAPPHCTYTAHPLERARPVAHSVAPADRASGSKNPRLLPTSLGLLRACTLHWSRERAQRLQRHTACVGGAVDRGLRDLLHVLTRSPIVQRSSIARIQFSSSQFVERRQKATWLRLNEWGQRKTQTRTRGPLAIGVEIKILRLTRRRKRVCGYSKPKELVAY